MPEVTGRLETVFRSRHLSGSIGAYLDWDFPDQAKYTNQTLSHLNAPRLPTLDLSLTTQGIIMPSTNAGWLRPGVIVEFGSDAETAVPGFESCRSPLRDDSRRTRSSPVPAVGTTKSFAVLPEDLQAAMLRHVRSFDSIEVEYKDVKWSELDLEIQDKDLADCFRRAAGQSTRPVALVTTVLTADKARFRILATGMGSGCLPMSRIAWDHLTCFARDGLLNTRERWSSGIR